MSDFSRVIELRDRLMGKLVIVSKLYGERYVHIDRAQALDIDSDLITPIKDELVIGQYASVEYMNEAGLQEGIRHLEVEIREVEADNGILAEAIRNANAVNKIEEARTEAGEYVGMSPEDRQEWLEMKSKAYKEAADGEEKSKIWFEIFEEVRKTEAAVKKIGKALASKETGTEGIAGLKEDVRKMAGLVCAQCGAASKPDGGELLRCRCGTGFCKRECQVSAWRSGHREICRET